MMMNSIKAGILSNNQDVSSWTCRVLSKIGYEFSNSDLIAHGWDWFVDEKAGCIGTTIEGIDKH